MLMWHWVVAKQVLNMSIKDFLCMNIIYVRTNVFFEWILNPYTIQVYDEKRVGRGLYWFRAKLYREKKLLTQYFTYYSLLLFRRNSYFCFIGTIVIKVSFIPCSYLHGYKRLIVLESLDAGIKCFIPIKMRMLNS